MVAHSSEFENIVVREEEQMELEALARECPLEIKGGPSSKHGKISILIQVQLVSLNWHSPSIVSCLVLLWFYTPSVTIYL